MYQHDSNPPNQRSLPPMELSCCEVMQKNKPQSNSIAGGLLLLMVSGLHIGWGIWRTSFNDLWLSGISQGMFTFILTTWYIGAILGSYLGTYLLTRFRKKKIYYLSGTILLISSIIFTAARGYAEGILCARLLAGFGHGIVYIATITHGAENAVKEMRGRLLSSVNYMIITTMFTMASIYTSTNAAEPYDNTLNDLILGICAITFTVMGLMFVPCLTYESVPFLLKRDLEREALHNMMKLRNESFESWTIRNDLQEMKLMVNEDKTDDWYIFSGDNLRPLFLMLGTRLLAVLSNNMVLNTLMIGLTQKAFTDVAYVNVATLLLIGCRFAFGIIPLFSNDSISRKKQLSLSGAIAGTILLIYSVISVGFQVEQTVTWLPALFFAAYQAIIALGIDPLQHILMAEAFVTSTKAYWSITFVTVVENVLQVAAIVLVTSLTFNDVGLFVVLFVTSLGSLVLHLVLEYFMPETNKLSLRQTRLEFRGSRFEYLDNEQS